MNQLRKASFRNRQFRFESAGRNGHQRRALARRCPVGCRSRITPRAELSELRELSHAQRRAAYTSVEGAKERVLHTSEREKDDARSDFLAGQQPAWFVLTVGRNCAWLSAVDAGRSSDFACTSKFSPNKIKKPRNILLLMDFRHAILNNGSCFA